MTAFVVADAHGNVDAVAGLLLQEGIIDATGDRVNRDTTVIQIGDLCNCVSSSIAADNSCLDHAEEWFDVYLVGNHEHPYFGGPAFSGFFRDQVLLHRLLRLDASGMIKPCVAVDGVLISHAGLAEELEDWADGRDAEEFASGALELWDDSPTRDLFSTIGSLRGGWSSHGGILWSDWGERKSRLFPQVVGHTVGDTVRRVNDGDWYAVCIDLGAKDYGSRIAGAWLRDGQCESVIFDPSVRAAA